MQRLRGECGRRDSAELVNLRNCWPAMRGNSGDLFANLSSDYHPAEQNFQFKKCLFLNLHVSKTELSILEKL